jgi:hypothetical protein
MGMKRFGDRGLNLVLDGDMQFGRRLILRD